MALKKVALAAIAKLTKLKVEDLEAAIKDENEVDVTIDETLTPFSEDEIATLKTNEYKRGSASAVEIAVKDLKTKEGLDFTGKTLDGLVAAVSKKAVADAKIEPAKAVTDLQEKVTNLQKTVTEQEQKLADKEAEVTGVKINGELYKHIPAPAENGPAYDQDEVVLLMKNKGYDFKLENGKIVPYKDGKQILDKTSNPREPKDIISEFMTEKKYITTPAPGPDGRGGGDQKPPSKATKLSELKKEYEAAGKSLNGSEFMEAVDKAVSANKDFVLD